MNPTQLHRAVANALWPALRRRHWEVARKTRAISPTGNPRGHNYAPGQIPGPEPTVEVLDHIRYLEATATSAETRLGCAVGVELTYVDACAALARLSHAAVAEYDEALDVIALRFQRPFVWKGTHYRRNDQLKRRAAIALQAVAAAATIRILTVEEDASLNDDHGINADEVFVAAERARA